MKFLRRIIDSTLQRIPVWTLSALLIGAVLWLTLASKPLGDDAPKLFDGADKIAHALMFGVIAAAVMYDWQRSGPRRCLSAAAIVVIAIGTALFGAATEWMQDAMHVGRSFEWGDMAADAAGALVAALIAFKLHPLSTANK